MVAETCQNLTGNIGAGARVAQGIVTWIEGFTAEQVRSLIESAMRGADEKLATISQRLGLTLGAMRMVLITIGEADVPDDQVLNKFAEVSGRYVKAVTAIAALRPDNPTAREHVTRAAAAVARGNRDEARQQLQAACAAAIKAADEAHRLSREAAATSAQYMLQAASAAAAEAEVAFTALNYLDAVRLLGKAVTLMPPCEPPIMEALLLSQADALIHHGGNAQDKTSLLDAIVICSNVASRLVLYCKCDELTLAHMLKGDALRILALTTINSQTLIEAVRNFDATFDGDPFTWILCEARKSYEFSLSRSPDAGTQIKIALVVQELGMRDAGVELLKEALRLWKDIQLDSQGLVSSWFILRSTRQIENAIKYKEYTCNKTKAGKISIFSVFTQWSEKRKREPSRDMAFLLDSVRSVLSQDPPDRPVDVSHVPEPVNLVKEVILKRLSLNYDGPDLLSRSEAKILYLDLSRFIDDWDNLDCGKVYFKRPGDTAGKVLKRLLNCISLEKANRIVEAKRLELAQELQAFDSRRCPGDKQ